MNIYQVAFYTVNDINRLINIIFYNCNYPFNLFVTCDGCKFVTCDGCKIGFEIYNMSFSKKLEYINFSFKYIGCSNIYYEYRHPLNLINI